MRDNPLLESFLFPPFDKLSPFAIEPAIDVILSTNRKKIQELIAIPVSNLSWKTFIEPFMDLEERLDKIWNIVCHLHSISNNEEIRKVYYNCLPKITEYYTEIMQNTHIYEKYILLEKSVEYNSMNLFQKKVIENVIRDFKLSGIELTEDKKERLRFIIQRLNQLSANFEDNVLDSTNAWTLLVSDIRELEGVPNRALKQMQASAKEKNYKDGWLLTLDQPCYEAIITYAHNRSLREKIYTAYITRASDKGLFPKKWDNTKIIEEILQLRQEKAKLLGFDNYAALSLFTKSAKTVDKVFSFLYDLLEKIHPIAKKEYEELKAYAKKENIVNFEPWDFAYYSEKLKQSRFHISEETLRPYFNLEKVLEGLFEITHRLYSIQVKEVYDIPVWHDSIRVFTLYDDNKNLRGHIYFDLYTRSEKSSGAWMSGYQNRYQHALHGLQTPIAFLICNFSQPTKEQISLLKHSEVLTLFHEFGHSLHHVLTQVPYPSIAGMQGVPWDVVECPSQFMEFWAWEKEAIPLISAHFEDKSPLPAEFLEQLVAAKNFQTCLYMTRQLEYSLFDLHIHSEKNPLTQKVLDTIRSQVSVLPIASFNRFQHSFSHIFAGGYAAGYYSYYWADVWASDAYEEFEKEGIFNSKVGQKFLKSILESGGSQDPVVAFTEFKGRNPSINAFLRHQGIKNESN